MRIGTVRGRVGERAWGGGHTAHGLKEWCPCEIPSTPRGLSRFRPAQVLETNLQEILTAVKEQEELETKGSKVAAAKLKLKQQLS